MDLVDVRVVEFEAMRVVTCRRVGEQAADSALETLIGWASERGLLARRQVWKPALRPGTGQVPTSALRPGTRAPATETSFPRFFGFGEPLPVGDDLVYVFEAWMTVAGDETLAGDEALAGDETVGVQRVPGGLYAVTTVTPEANAEGAAWERFEARLDPWMAENGYQYDDTRQWLEAYVPDPDRMARLPELEAGSRWVAIDLCIPIEPAAESDVVKARRKNGLRNLVALILTIAVFAFASGTLAGLEARRGPDWYLELQGYIAQSAQASETVKVVAIVDATEPVNFRTGMGTPTREDWRSTPIHAVKCVLLERSRPLTPGGEPVSRRQVVFLAYHSDALYRVGWLAYAGPREPFGQEIKANLREVGCELGLE
jgi:DNA gyrase inhibitor GyrI